MIKVAICDDDNLIAHQLVHIPQKQSTRSA